MAKEKNNQLSVSMTYGLMLGLALVVYTLILYVTDLLITKNFAIGLVNYVIIIAGIILGTKKLREVQNGTISYGQALGTGVMVSLFSSLLVGIFSYLLYSVIDPDLINQTLALMEERFVSQGKLSEDQIEMILERASEGMTPMRMVIGSVFTFTFLGFIFSLITSAFLKKEASIFDESKLAEEE